MSETSVLSVPWRSMNTAPRDGKPFLGVYGGQVRVFQYGKTSHVPMYGFCLADQGIEDFDLIEDSKIRCWTPMPELPAFVLRENTSPYMQAMNRQDHSVAE